jgi:hypothetical protein
MKKFKSEAVLVSIFATFLLTLSAFTGCGPPNPPVGGLDDTTVVPVVDAGTPPPADAGPKPVLDAGFKHSFTEAIGGQGALVLKGCYDLGLGGGVDHQLGVVPQGKGVAVACSATQTARNSGGGCVVTIDTLTPKMDLKTGSKLDITCTIEGVTASTPCDAGTFVGTFDPSSRVLQGSFKGVWPKTHDHTNGSTSGSFTTVVP